MIYNMLTISIQLLFIGFFVSMISHYLFKRNSFPYIVELLVAVFGSFLGMLIEVWVRFVWEFPILVLIIFQFLIPFCISSVFIIILRLTNNPHE